MTTTISCDGLSAPGSKSGRLQRAALDVSMNTSRRRITAALALAAVLVLAGCSRSNSSGSASPGSVAPSASASTPAAAHNPASAAALARQLKDAGLPVRHLIVYMATTDPNHELGRQGGYTSKVAWQDRRAVAGGMVSGVQTGTGIDLGGGIEVFPTVAAAQKRMLLLSSVAGTAFGDGYDYLAGKAVLRLSRYLTPTQARAYRVAFTAAVSR
jgi:hypothetical protein